MFGGKKPAAQQVEMPNTVIGKGITLESALLTGKESVRIDGIFYGDVDLDGSLILGDTGCIEGFVRAKYIILAGRVNGNIECSGTVHVASTARVQGDISTQSIIVDEGGQLNGRNQVGDQAAISTTKDPNQPLLTGAAGAGGSAGRGEGSGRPSRGTAGAIGIRPIEEGGGHIVPDSASGSPGAPRSYLDESLGS